LNNIEWIIRIFFPTEEAYVKSFVKFVHKLHGKKIVVLNFDSDGVKKLISRLDKSFLKTLNVYGYRSLSGPVTETGKVINTI